MRRRARGRHGRMYKHKAILICVYVRECMQALRSAYMVLLWLSHAVHDIERGTLLSSIVRARYARQRAWGRRSRMHKHKAMLNCVQVRECMQVLRSACMVLLWLSHAMHDIERGTAQ